MICFNRDYCHYMCECVSCLMTISNQFYYYCRTDDIEAKRSKVSLIQVGRHSVCQAVYGCGCDVLHPRIAACFCCDHLDI